MASQKQHGTGEFTLRNLSFHHVVHFAVESAAEPGGWTRGTVSPASAIALKAKVPARVQVYVQKPSGEQPTSGDAPEFETIDIVVGHDPIVARSLGWEIVCTDHGSVCSVQNALKGCRHDTPRRSPLALFPAHKLPSSRSRAFLSATTCRQLNGQNVLVWALFVLTMGVVCAFTALAVSPVGDLSGTTPMINL